MRTLLTLAAAAAAGIALVACGGGSDYTPPPPPAAATAVPDSAIASSPAFISYLNGQSFIDETGEPLTLPAGDLATSETDEPIAI
ncbi:MAG: hypothetical protein EOP35_06760 [Rubrivivax sp.]|nr:MAG: hypothetical protein EOP35_06760 [Rubrivivax sp.]